MNKRTIFLKPHLNERETRCLEGLRPTANHYNTIIASDVDAYDQTSGRHIFSLRTTAIESKYTSLAESIFNDINQKMKPSFSRASAAGLPDLKRIKSSKKNIIGIEQIEGKPYHFNLIYADKRVGRSELCNPVNSYMAGWNYDRYKKLGKQCGFSKSFPIEWNKVIPFFEEINSAFKDICPSEHLIMENWVKENNIFPKLTIGNTVLTTVAINVNYESCFHFDRGDYEDGYSTLTTISPTGDYEGGFLVLPKYKVAIDVRPGSLLINQSHKDIHGNTRIKKKESLSKRISFVTYLKKTLKHAINK